MSAENDKQYPANAILPVIHLQSNEQAVDMAGRAQEAGAGGVFVIDHRYSTMEHEGVLAKAVFKVMDAHPNLWVGVNCLALGANGALKYFGNRSSLGVHGVWTDNVIGWRYNMRLTEANMLFLDRCGGDLRAKDSPAVLFGGLAMKGEGYIEDDDEAASLVAHAQKYVDVVTVSGEGTGQSMSMDRLSKIRDVVQGGKIAVASGVSPYNLTPHLEYADYVLVGSSIETGHLSGRFDEEKLKHLMGVFFDYDVAGLRTS